MIHDPAAASRPIAVLADVTDYWTAYVASLAGGPTQSVPVLSEHPERTAALLRAHGYPIETADLPKADLPARYRSLGRELASAGDDIEWLASVEPALRCLTSAPLRTDGATIVGVGRSAALGLLRAVADGRAFTAAERLDDIRPGSARSLFVVADDLGRTDPGEVQRRIDTDARWEILPGVRACPVGFLTGRDAAMMTLLDARQRLLPRGTGDATVDVLIDCTLASPPAAVADGLDAVPYRATSRQTLSGRAIGLLAITSHGMSDLLHLNDDYVCGKSWFLGVSSPDPTRVPSCEMAEGGFCYFKPAGQPVAAYEITADHVFVNSCGSLRFDHSDFDPLYNIWYTVLEGRARSFVGSVRWKDGHGLEGLLYRHLLRRGALLGTAVAVLNRALRSNQIEGEGVYLLLGDPDERLVGRPVVEPPQRWQAGDRVFLQEGWGHTVVDSPPMVGAFADGELLVDVLGATGVATSFVPTDDGRALHAFVYGYDAHTGDVQLGLEDFGGEFAEVVAIGENLAMTLDPVLGMHGLYPDRVRQGRRKNLEARLLQVSRLAKQRFTDPNATGKLRRTCRRLFAEVDQADAEIATWMYDRIRATSYRFSEHYQESFLLADVGVRGVCPLCGGGTTERQLRHALRQWVRRTELICHACGGVADTPEPRLLVSVGMDERQVPGTSGVVTVGLANHTGRVRTGYCLASVRRSSQYQIGQSDTVQRVQVGTGAVTTVKFRFDWDAAMPDHQYDLQAAFVAQTQLYLGRRDFWLAR